MGIFCADILGLGDGLRGSLQLDVFCSYGVALGGFCGL